MPSTRAYNQAPFWDWVSSFEDLAASHPWAAGNNPRGNRNDAGHQNPFESHGFTGPPGFAGLPSWGGPSTWGGQLPHRPHRGRNGPWGRPRGPHHQGPPRAASAEASFMPPPPPPAFETTPASSDDEIETLHMGDTKNVPHVTVESDSEGHGNHSGPERRRGGGMRGRGGARGRGGCNHHGHGHGHGRHGVGNNNGNNNNRQQTGEPSTGPRYSHRFGGRRGPAANPPPFPFSAPAAAIGSHLGEFFQNQLFGNQDTKDKDSDIFKPEVDVFDGPDAFFVHISLPGAKKEDVSVHWEADKSELTIAGVVYRPADEEMLKTLSMDERKVGEFERKVRLGSRSHPAPVDVDGISAKMEDGILRIDVPKMDAEYVEIKHVNIE